MVVARAHAVEDRARELQAQRCAVGLVDHQRALQATASHLELDTRTVGVQLVRDHVAEVVAVDQHDLVARVDARERGRGSGRDGDDSCGGHVRKCTGGPPANTAP